MYREAGLQYGGILGADQRVKESQAIKVIQATLSASGISNASDLGTNSYGICLTEKDIYVLHRQTNFMAVRYEVRRVGYV